MKRVFGVRALACVLIMLSAVIASAQEAQWRIVGMAWEPAPFEPGFALVSDLSHGQPGFGVVSRDLPPGTQVGEIVGLSYSFLVEVGDCGGGSPRLQLAIDTNGDGTADGNAFGYGGPYPNFSGCPAGVWIAEDAQDDADGRQWDLTQFGGGFYNTWTETVAFFSYVPHQVLRVVWVNDSSWIATPPRMWLDDLNVNGAVLDEPTDVAP